MKVDKQMGNRQADGRITLEKPSRNLLVIQIGTEDHF